MSCHVKARDKASDKKTQNLLVYQGALIGPTSFSILLWDEIHVVPIALNLTISNPVPDPNLPNEPDIACQSVSPPAPSSALAVFEQEASLPTMPQLRLSYHPPG